MRRTVALALCLAALAGCGGDDDDGGGGGGGGGGGQAGVKAPTAGELELWVGGNFAGATPGTPYREWLDAQVDRFKAENAGSDVKITLLSTDNEQVAAKLQAAFQARSAPDMMLFYSGGYTTPYAPQLLELNPYFDATPGLLRLAVAAWTCPARTSTARAARTRSSPCRRTSAPTGSSTTRRCSQKAGVEAPIESWDDLLGRVRRAQGVRRHPDHVRRPRRLLDRQLGHADVRLVLRRTATWRKVNDGELPYADPSSSSRSSSWSTCASAAASTRTPPRARTSTRTRTSRRARARWC